MAYSAPTTFSDGTTLLAAEVEGNFDALRVYLHEGIVAGDFESAKWIQTRHIQPPDFQPFTGVQHGVTGHQGGQWAGGVNIRMTFATKFLTGNGQQDVNTFANIPNTSFTLDIRRSASVLFHYWFELESGNDNSVAAYQVAQAERAVFIAPWFDSIDTAYSTYRHAAQETRNQNYAIANNFPNGVSETFVQGGGYGAKQGTIYKTANASSRLRFGLASHSRVDRVGIVNWGIAAEVFYI